MPPRVKITKEEIVQATLDLMRKQGDDALNARAIASALNCSTQPVFSNFATMELLKASVVESAYECYLDFLRREAESGRYPRYKAFGMAYIRFAEEEKELFKLLFMRDRTQEEKVLSLDFEESVQMIMHANGLTKERATRMHLETWACVHGIAVMIATSFLSFDWEMISDMLSDVYQGVRARHLEEEKEHARNSN